MLMLTDEVVDAHVYLTFAAHGENPADRGSAQIQEIHLRQQAAAGVTLVRDCGAVPEAVAPPTGPGLPKVVSCGPLIAPDIPFLAHLRAPVGEGRGLVAAAVRELLCEAVAARDGGTVLAPTLGEPGRSVRVLEKARFVQPGEVPDDEVRKSPRLDRTEAPWQDPWRRGHGAGRCHRQPLGAPAS